jgi:hypothetical protein
LAWYFGKVRLRIVVYVDNRTAFIEVVTSNMARGSLRQNHIGPFVGFDFSTSEKRDDFNALKNGGTATQVKDSGFMASGL